MNGNKASAISTLWAQLPIGSTVWFVQRGRSASGMTHYLDCYVIEDNQPWRITGLVARATGHRYGGPHDSLVARGVGMDMATAVAHDLAAVLYPDTPPNEALTRRWLS